MPVRLFIFVFTTLLSGTLSAQTHTLNSLGGPLESNIREIHTSKAGNMFVVSGAQCYYRHFVTTPLAPLPYFNGTEFDYFAMDSSFVPSVFVSHAKGFFSGSPDDYDSSLHGGLFRNITPRLQDRPITATKSGHLLIPQDNFIMNMGPTGASVADTLPTTSQIDRVEANGDTIIAITPLQLLARIGKSNWKAIDSALPSRATTLAFSPYGLIVGTRSSGVFISDSVGGAWMSISAGLANLDVHDLMFDQGRIIVGSDSGVYITSNRGKTWLSVPGDVGNFSIRCLASDRGIWYAGTDGHGLFSSSDKGKVWAAKEISSTKTAVLAIQEYKNHIWTGSSNAVHTYDLTDNVWIPQRQGLPRVSTISKFIIANTQLYALELNSGLYKWRDGQKDWIKISHTQQANSQFVDMELVDSNIMLATSDTLYSVNLMSTLTQSQACTSKIYDIEYRNGFAYLASSAGVMISSDGGDSWNITSSGPVRKVVAVGAVLVAESLNGTLLRSTDRGVDWAESAPFTDLQLSDGKLYAVADGIYVSVDSGLSWEKSVTGNVGRLFALFTTSRTRVLLGLDYEGLQEIVEQSGVFQRPDLAPNTSGRIGQIVKRGLDVKVECDTKEVNPALFDLNGAEHFVSSWLTEQGFSISTTALSPGFYLLRYGNSPYQIKSILIED